MTTIHKKKLLCLILSVALLVCLAACGAPSEPEDRNDGQQQESTGPYDGSHGCPNGCADTRQRREPRGRARGAWRRRAVDPRTGV